MADKSSKRRAYLPHFRAREQKSGRVYYYFDTGAAEGKARKEIPLGSDLNEAIAKYSKLKKTDLTPPRATVTFGDAARRYLAQVVPTKAKLTQKGNIREMEELLAYFDNPPVALDFIEPVHVRAYLDARADSPVRANREKALLSHLFNKAREWGLTSSSNPCAGVKAYPEKGRKDVYIEDDVYEAVYDKGDQILQDAMEIAYLTAQRTSDVLQLNELNIQLDKKSQEEVLALQQEKTGERLRISLSKKNDPGTDASADRPVLEPNTLGKLLAKMSLAKQMHENPTNNFLCDRKGRPLTYDALCNRFVKARAAAAQAATDSAEHCKDPRERQRYQALAESIKNFQFRDLRAKAGTDIVNSTGSLSIARRHLGHRSEGMTEQYIRSRQGDKVNPTR